MIRTTEYIPSSPMTDIEHSPIRQRVIIGGTLAAVSVGAIVGQYTGLNQQLSTIEPGGQTLETIANSLAHPAIGYLGAMATVWAADHLHTRPSEIVSAIIGGTAANFGVEAIQDRFFTALQTNNLTNTETQSHFWQQAQWAESAKDYMFALGGVAIYVISEKILRHDNRKK